VIEELGSEVDESQFGRRLIVPECGRCYWCARGRPDPCGEAARVEPGSSVAVLGCGDLGLWMVEGARVAGAALVDPAVGDPVEQARALTDRRGADLVPKAARRDLSGALLVNGA